MREKRLNWDIVGMWAAGVCAVHCALFPILLTVGVLSGATAWAHPIIETLFVGISLLIGVFVLWPQFKNMHRNPFPLILMFSGILLIVGGHFFGLHDYEPILTTIGAVLVLSSHFLNWKLFKRSSTDK